MRVNRGARVNSVCKPITLVHSSWAKVLPRVILRTDARMPLGWRPSPPAPPPVSSASHAGAALC